MIMFKKTQQKSVVQSVHKLEKKYTSTTKQEKKNSKYVDKYSLVSLAYKFTRYFSYKGPLSKKLNLEYCNINYETASHEFVL